MDDDENEIDKIKLPSFKDLFLKYINKIVVVLVIFGILVYIYFQVGLASLNKRSLTSRFEYNIFAIVIPVIGVMSFILLSTIDKGFGMFLIAGTIIAIAVFGMLFYFLKSNLSQYIFNKYLLYTVIVFGILIALSIVSTLLSETLRRQVGWSGFFSNLLFYIPCIIRDGIKGAVNEYNSFSTTLVILFTIEILILLMYFFLIPTINDNAVPTNVSILGDPVMLSAAVPLSVAPIYTGTGPWNNFAISMWVYVNPAPNTKLGYTEKTPIFSYRRSATDNYFTVQYSNDSKDQNLFQLDISNTNMNNIFGPNNPISFNMPLQKWNNIVFNVVTEAAPNGTGKPAPTVASYGKAKIVDTTPTVTTIDIFLNGELIHSCPLNKTPEFSPTDAINIGSGTMDKNVDSLYGAICNITYYREPLSRLSLIYNYNKLVINNPPV
jgi:hypothetical protein